MADAVFQFAPESVGGGRVGVSGAAPSLGVSGGNSTNEGAVRFADTTDLGAGSRLPEFLNEAFAPKIQAIQQQRIFEGYTQAAIGRSQEEISKDVPWYARVFGPVPYEAGAQKYTVDKTMADMDTYYMNEMPRLRTLAPQDVAKEIQEKALTHAQGHPYTSMLITQSLMERMGPMLDVHTKARYAWQQEELVNMQSDSDLAAAASFDATRRRISELGKENPNDPEIGFLQANVNRNFLAQMQRPEFQDPASAEKSMINSVMRFADNGHFSAIALLMETGIESTLDHDPALKAKLQGYVNQKWETYKEKSLVDDPDFLRKVVQVKTARNQGLGGAATVNDMKALDAEFQSKHGFLPYFSGQEYQSDAITSSNAWISNAEQAAREQAAAAKAAATDGEKEAAQARLVATFRDAVMTGQTAFVEALDGADKSLLDTVMVSTWKEVNATNPALAAQMLVWNQSNEGNPSTEITRVLRQRVDNFTNGPYNDGYLALQQQYETMRAGVGFRLNPVTGRPDMQDTLAGVATARAYFGDEAATRMERFSDLRAAGTPPQEAYKQVWGDDPTARPTLAGATSADAKDARSKMESAISGFGPSMYKSVFGGATDTRLTRSGRQYLAAYAAEEYNALPDNGDNASRVKNSLHNVKAKGLEIHGQFVWKNPLGAQQPRIASYFNSNDTAFAPVIDATINGKLRAVGVYVDDDTIVSTTRLPDVAGKPRLAVTVQDEDLQWVTVQIDAADIDKVRTAGPPPRVEIPLRPRAGGRNTN